MFQLDDSAVKSRMAELNLGVTEVARLTGLSRQAIYAMMKPGFRPLLPSVDAVFNVLGLSPADALVHSSHEDDVIDLLSSAASGKARAFEMLPAALAKASRLPTADEVRKVGPTGVRLMAAAAEIAAMHEPERNKLRPYSERLQAEAASTGAAFFFGLGLMTPQRLVESTPPVMARHNVFGAFSESDFSRHF